MNGLNHSLCKIFFEESDLRKTDQLHLSIVEKIEQLTGPSPLL